MNRHNFHQFNPNSYKKHLSPLGRNVLDNLIRNWRTGFNNANERPHQQTLDQNKRNSSLGDSRSSSHHISSMPSTPATIKTPYRNDIDTYQQLDTQNNNAFPKPLIPVTLTINYESLPNVPINQLLRDNSTHDDLPNAVLPSSAELVRTIDTADADDNEILTANDMITPVINFQNKANQKFLQAKKVNDDICVPPVNFLEVLNKEKDVVTTSEGFQSKDVNSGGKNVYWSDMFDTELFPPDLHGPGHFERSGVQDNVNDFEITFPKAKNNTKRGKDKTNVSTANAPEKTICKRKHQKKITDTVPKKVKKVTCNQGVSENVTKSGYKKMKYTKAVTNWLDDVNPGNLIQEEIEDNNVTSVAYSENQFKGQRITLKDDLCVKKVNTSNKAFIEIDKKPKEKPKKVIQTRLAQKDGKMKFGLPNEKSTVSKAKPPVVENSSEIQVNTETKITETVEDKKTDPTYIELPAIGIVSEFSVNTETKGKETVKEKMTKPEALGPSMIDNSSALQINTETKNKDTVKEKKTKPKFIAPIKSQIPVKNMSFDVKTINKSNVGLIEKIMEFENNEVVMILVYRNGFCQLNNHHTEETCVPEGIMIQFKDDFFYLKEENIEYGKLIEELVHKMYVIAYNGKQLLMYLKSKFNIELKQCTFNITDAKIGGSLIDPDNPPENFAELQKLLGFTPEFTIATECVLQKAAWYITLLSECFARLKSLLIENSVWNVFIDIEMRLLPIIAGMESHGVSVDIEKLKSMEDILLKKIKAVEQECYKAAGKTFQINSTLQVRTILYDELQLDTKSNLKIKETISKGAKSTSETMLRGLMSAHPLPKLILEYRHLHKAHATFLTGIAQHVKDGLVKPTWVQTAAATGRIASNNPNLQAIPKAPFSLVMFPKNDDAQEPQLNFRSVYTARAGHVLLAADFKHIECRVFAHAAADETLLDALRSGRDLFRVLAAKWLNKPEAEISTEDRERTKRIVYASLYGAGARKLMEILRVGYEQALAVMGSFNRTFPALKAFGRASVARACAGALSSLCGRARRFRHIASADFALRSHAERQAVNFVVQGSAADLCKKAMVLAEQRLQECRPPVQGRLMLQIHDELVWEILDEDLERAASIIKETMENIGHQCGMAMTLPVEMSSGRNWGEMQPYPLTE